MKTKFFVIMFALIAFALISFFMPNLSKVYDSCEMTQDGTLQFAIGYQYTNGLLYIDNAECTWKLFGIIPIVSLLSEETSPQINDLGNKYTIQQLRERYDQIHQEVESIKEEFTSGKISQENYVSALENLAEHEMDLFQDVKEHTFDRDEMTEYNFWYRGVMKFPTTIEQEITKHISKDFAEPRITGKISDKICSITGGQCPPYYIGNIQEDGSVMVGITFSDGAQEKQFVFLIKNGTLSYEEYVREN